MKRAAAVLLRMWWRLRGGRTIQAFGQTCRFTAETELPIRLLVRLPARGALSNIVRYADLVQFHAACRFLSELRRPAVVVDVGAHHGTYAVIMGKFLQRMGGTLIAIEPNPDSARVLRENVSLNGLEATVRCEQVAVLDRAGQMRLDLNGSQSHVTTGVHETGVQVPVVTLKGLLEKHRAQRVDLLMIDVEGAELPVLRGFPWGEVPLDWLLCELHPYAWQAFGYSGKDMTAFLREHGYRCIDAYLKEHAEFSEPGYIGPTRFLSVNNVGNDVEMDGTASMRSLMRHDILILVPCLLVGGTEMHTLALARALAGGGCRVVVCAYYEHDPIMVRAIERAGATVRLLRLKRAGGRNLGRLPALIGALAQLIHEERPGAVHVQYMAPGLVPILVARLVGVPHVVATVHVPGRHYRRGLWLPRSIAARLCDAFLCVSPSAERSFFGDSAEFDENLLARGRRHFTIPNCVDLELVDRLRSEDARDLKRGLGLDGRRVVGMVSRMTSEKGPQFLIEAMVEVLRETPEAKLLMVGDGALRPALEARAAALGIANNVVWVGRLAREEAYRHMALMDVVVVPSQWEGFGLTAAEAMAFGKPVVASDVDGLRNVVDGQSGRLVAAGDVAGLGREIGRLMADESRRSEMGRAGRKRVVEHFSLEAFSARHVRLYRALFNCVSAVERGRDGAEGLDVAVHAREAG